MKSTSLQSLWQWSKKWTKREHAGRTQLQKRRKFRLELLESRRVMAGDITGTVFQDLNANGIDETNEPGLAGWTVFVDSNGDGLPNAGEPSTVTDTKGKFALVGLPVATVQLYEVQQPGFVPTPGFSNHQAVTVREGREVRVRFPNVASAAATGRVVGTVFEDTNENGIKESGEHGLLGWTMFIDSNGDGSLSTGEPTAITDADGDYIFAEVPTGAATIFEIPQAGYRPTIGGLFPTTGALDHQAVNVVANTSSRADFANLIPQVGTIQGKVWNDQNGDGIAGATDPGIANRTVYVDLNLNQILDAGEPSRITDGSGAFSFVDIHTGSYQVRENRPDGWVSSIGTNPFFTTFVSRGSVQNLSFMDLIPGTGSISGKVWNDEDGNGLLNATEQGLAGWSVFVDSNSNSQWDAGEPRSTTDTNGNYSIPDLPYAMHSVRVELPSTWIATSPTTGVKSVRSLTGDSVAGVQFGVREKVGSIQGTVWNDDNGDAIRNAGESGLAGWQIWVDLNGNASRDADEPVQTSDATGSYTLARIPVGTYSVYESLPEGWINSVGRPSSVTTTLTIGSRSQIDYYNLQPRMGSISGSIFSDTNINGIADAGEAGLSNWEVFLDVNNDGIRNIDEPTTLTGVDGTYTLNQVPYGNNVVRTVLMPGYTSTNFPGGLARTSLLNGENKSGISFGIHEPTDFSISGSAFSDANKNGVRDAGERGLSGITVYLDLNNNGVHEATEPSTQTSVDLFFTPKVDETGQFSFTHLTRGSYVVREIVPVEQDATPEAARSTTVDVGPASVNGVAFANQFRANEIHGVIFDDTDDDGVFDSNEYARPGVTVYVDSNRNDLYDVGELETITSVDGTYAFTGLVPGAYVVREVATSIGPHTYPMTGGGDLWPQGTSNVAQGQVTPSSITTSLREGQSYTQTVSVTLPGGGSGITNLVDVFLLFDDTGSFAGNSPIVRAAFPTIISSLQASLPGIDFGFGVGRFEEYGGFAFENATGRPFVLNQPIVAQTTTGFSTAIQSALDRMAPGYGGDQPETDIEALYQVVTGLGFDGNNNGSTLDSGAAGLASTQLTPGASGDVPGFASFHADPTNGVLAPDGTIGGVGFRNGALPIILTATDTGFAYQPKGELDIVGAGGLTLPLSALTQTSRPSTPFASGAGIQETVTALNALGALVIGLGTNPQSTLDPRQGLESLAKLTGAVNNSLTTISNGTTDPIAPGDPLYFQISTGFGATVANGIVNAIQNAVTNVAVDISLRVTDPSVRLINHSGTRLGVGAGQSASFDIEFIGDGKPHRFDLQFVREGTNVVLGSIPIVLGTPVTGEGYQFDDLEDGEIHRSSHFGNYVPNVAPSFTKGMDIVVNEDAGSQSFANWATTISKGASTESGQTVNFLVQTSNPTLFSSLPSISADGTLTFTPAPNANGSADITVRIHDDGGIGRSGSDTSLAQNFVIQIQSVNDAPQANSDHYQVAQDTPLVIPAPGVLINDSDVEGSPLAVRLAVAPLHGTVTLDANGGFNYIPQAGFFGVDTFTYVANDGALDSPEASVTIDVTRFNRSPVATPDTYETNQNTTLDVVAPGILLNDVDPDGDAITARPLTLPTHGTLRSLADGSLSYTPNVNYVGMDSFTYVANDGMIDSQPATVTIQVLSTNHAPMAQSDQYNVIEDTPFASTPNSILDNDTDSDGDSLQPLVLTPPLHGTLSLNANGTFLYTPTANYFGSDSFVYRVNDGQADSNLATVTLNIQAVNDAPIANDDSFSVTEDGRLNVVAPGVMSNDSDVEGDPVTVRLISGPVHGTLSLQADGSFSYVPDPNYNGSDRFTYVGSDGVSESRVATATISVASVNDAPVANADRYSTSEDTTLVLAAPGILANDSDVDSSVLSAVLVSNPLHGTLTLSPNGSIRYVPTLNYNGQDSFTYRTSDGLLSSSIATVTIDISAVNDAPVARQDNYATPFNTVLNIPARGVLNNDVDVDGDILASSLVSAPTSGSLTLNSDGSFSYQPAPGFNGLDSFVYRATDGTGASSSATVQITVSPPGPKFFVVDADAKATYTYAEDGRGLGNTLLNKSDSKPRGIASNSTGTIQWVIDGSGTVFIYQNDNTLLGQWNPQNTGKPEGIAVWNNDLWLVDPTQDRMFYFAGGANLRTGRVAPTSSFPLNSGNLNATDVVSDGLHLWVLNDTLAADRVFRYTVSGTLEGSWGLSTTNPSPTGIALDPNHVNHLWVVDASTDRIYQYANATSRITGSQEPDLTWALSAGNTNPQGIADPEYLSESSFANDVMEPLSQGMTMAEYFHDLDQLFGQYPTELEPARYALRTPTTYVDGFSSETKTTQSAAKNDLTSQSNTANHAMASTDALKDEIFATWGDLMDDMPGKKKFDRSRA